VISPTRSCGSRDLSYLEQLILLRRMARSEDF
jgi:hypothetical protein